MHGVSSGSCLLYDLALQQVEHFVSLVGDDQRLLFVVVDFGNLEGVSVSPGDLLHILLVQVLRCCRVDYLSYPGHADVLPDPHLPELDHSLTGILEEQVAILQTHLKHPDLCDRRRSLEKAGTP